MLPLLPLRLYYKATHPLPIERYSGSTWRSGFGAKLRELACMTGSEDCNGCNLRSCCAYGLIFDTHQTDMAQGLNSRHQEQPHPYVLSPVRMTADEAAIDFTCVPPSVAHLPLLLRALRSIKPSRKSGGEWQLSSIGRRADVSDTEAQTTLIWSPGQPFPSLTAHPLDCPAVPTAVRVIVEHPLRLRVRGQYLAPDNFTFTAMVAALTRRVEMLRGLSNSLAEELDRIALIAAANALTFERRNLHWQDWDRYSSRQKKTIPMGGVIGSFDLRGPQEALARLWPLLWLGQWLHVGKGAVMGLGRYRLDTIS